MKKAEIIKKMRDGNLLVVSVSPGPRNRFYETTRLIGKVGREHFHVHGLTLRHLYHSLQVVSKCVNNEPVPVDYVPSFRDTVDTYYTLKEVQS